MVPVQRNLIFTMIHWRQTAKPLTAANLLILVLKVFGGHTLTCQPAEYRIGNECCPMCLAGSRVKKECTEFRSTSCLPCLDGTYMNQPTGLKQCFPCTTCDEGSGLKIKSPCTTRSDAVCEPLDGFYCVDASQDGCDAAKRHRSCEPGQYVSKKGTASSDSECSACSQGTFSDGSSASCRPHTQCEANQLQLLTPGTASTDAECGEQIRRNHWTMIFMMVLFLLTVGVLIFHFVKKPKLGKDSNRETKPGENETNTSNDSRPADVVEESYQVTSH